MPPLNRSLQGRRILVIRLGAIGDVLLTTPLLRVLKRTFPDLNIDFLVKEKHAPLLQNHPQVNQLLQFSSRDGSKGWLALLRTIRQNKYDVILDLQNNWRSRSWGALSGVSERRLYRLGRRERFLMVYAHMYRDKTFRSVPQKYFEVVRDWDIHEDADGPEIYIPDTIYERVNQKVPGAGIQDRKSLILLAPGASKVTKRWPFERYIQVANYFLREGMEIGFIGGAADVLLCQKMADAIKGPVINLAGSCSLPESAAAIQRANVLITNDTGMMHMATAVATPVVAIFGPTSRHFGFFPYQSVSKVVEKELKCRPCSYHGSRKCPRGHFKCMLEITPEQVIEAAIRLLNEHDRI